jgi:hypothetical protein
MGHRKDGYPGNVKNMIDKIREYYVTFGTYFIHIKTVLFAIEGK